ncbi:MAG: 4Fe-4S dicluster domain-containing protein [bacterium]|nr:4Fe-4S dicluster domain-containing protein [bacterium]
MADKLISKEDLNTLIDNLAKDIDVFAPVKKGDMYLYSKISSSKDISLNGKNTKKPLKEVFFGQSEELISFKTAKKEIEIIESEEDGKKRVIIGSRPCDAAALPILDEVFGWDYKDSFYLDKRERTTIISITCNEVEESCFCTSFGNISPSSKEGSDLLLTDIGESFYVEVVTDKGDAIIEGNSNLFKKAENISQKDKRQKEAVEKVKRRVELEGLKEKLDINFEDPIWKEISQKCLGCAACTYLCPTCHCFDIQDEMKKSTGKRVRNWDSCAFGHFTQMPGHQPRTEQFQRFRQRVIHKFKYYVDKFNKTACVGCGRCIENCPVNMDITKVIEKIVSS